MLLVIFSNIFIFPKLSLFIFIFTCKWNEIFYLWRPNLTDEGDDFLIELAVASNSLVIITDNVKDIEVGELKFNIEVLTPKQFIERYRK